MSQSSRTPKQFSSEHVPDDVVSDILTLLPVKSLIRFRCVSKPWNSIITNPDFINTHFDRAKSLSISNSNNGYLLYAVIVNNYDQKLCIDVCNSDRTLTHISRFQMPISHVRGVGFCNGIFCLYNFLNRMLFLWNPSIRKFKMVAPAPTTRIHFIRSSFTFGFAYHSQNNDFKILRMASYTLEPPAAEVYTLSTDSWREVELSGSGPNIKSIDSLNGDSWNGSLPCLFVNGALHCIAETLDFNFILAFDVNDGKIREINLPPRNYLDRVNEHFERLAVFKGSLALIVFGEDIDEGIDICVIWVMREYGVVESWTKISVPVCWVDRFFGCTNNDELLIETIGKFLLSFDPVSLNNYPLGIPNSISEGQVSWMNHTANFMESLVLLDGTNY